MLVAARTYINNAVMNLHQPGAMQQSPCSRARCRKSPDELARLAGSPDAVFVPLHKGQNLVTSSPSQLSAGLAASPSLAPAPAVQHRPASRWHPALLPRASIAHLSDAGVGDVFLGLAPQQQAVFAVAVRDEAAAAKLLEGVSGTADVSTAPGACGSSPGVHSGRCMHARAVPVLCSPGFLCMMVITSCRVAGCCNGHSCT